MKSCSLKQVALTTAIGLGFFLLPAAHAQDTGNVRVVRLSLAEGQVLVSHPGTNVWEDAPANLPLQEGDTLATQSGRAEIEFENGATAYLAENSVLQFTRLAFSGGGRATDLTLTQGAGTFNSTVSGQDSFRVEALTFNVTIPQHAEFRVDGFRDGAAVEVLSGDVSVSTTRGSTTLDKGQGVAVHEKDFQDMSVGSLPNAEDAFDQWVIKQGEMIRAGNKNTLSYINSPNDYGLSDLSRYGSWVNIAGFGYSWRPFSVGFTWAPYLNGRWIFNPILGWIWVSSEAWGWMPYHFGSWLLSPNLGWVWVPGGPAGLQQWQAARVNWVSAGDRVGWVAMSPNDRDGAPANTARGIVTKSGRSPGNGIESNEILMSKDLRMITPLKQPPDDFASRTTPGAPRRGIQSTIRMAPVTPNNNGSAARDTGTNPPFAPAALMPQLNSQAGLPRVTKQPEGPTDPQANRVIFPAQYLTAPAPHRNVPTNGLSPAHPPMSPPLNTQPRPVSPPPAMPRAVAPAPATHAAAPAQAGSAPHPAKQAPQPASPPAPADHH
jgi:hypothetical protein